MAVAARLKKKLTDPKATNIDMVFNELNDMVHNAMISREALLKQFMDPRRDIAAECGYPDSLDAFSYKKLYDRDPIAARVVEVMPKESWKVTPSVYEDEDIDKVTDFEEAWDSLAKTVRGKSWYDDEEGSPIWEALMRADILSGVGSYGILLLGIDDGRPLNEPVKGVEEVNSFPVELVTDPETKEASLRPVKQRQDTAIYNLTTNAKEIKGRKLVRLMPFDEASAQVVQWETNRSSPRYGQPVMYLVNFNDPSSQELSGIGMPMSTENVHWTRVIHLSDTSTKATSNDSVVESRMKCVLNRLLDLQKLYGGSAEMYWKGAFPGISAETHPQLGGDVELDVAATQDQLEQYMNTLQRYLITSGLSVKMLSPTVVDPTSQINVQIDAICIKIEVPIPVFKGYEIGEQASTNNDEAWNDRLKTRQIKYITPRVIVPFVDRLIMIGVLPEPKSYHVTWPDMDSVSASEQASVALTRTQALTAYVSGQGEAIIAPLDFYTRILGMTDEEAESILENVQDHLKESYPDTEDTTTPGAIPAPPKPEPEPGVPIKIKEGETLVSPDGNPLQKKVGA